MLEVLAGSDLATIQDAGRTGWAHLGVPVAGACDPRGFAVANALLDNPPGAACLEISVGGVELIARERAVLAIGGTDLGATVAGENRPLATGRTHLLWPGQSVVFSGRPADRTLGARAYVAVPGGFLVDKVMGSASTSLVGRFGGLGGRGLRPGDMLRSGRTADPRLAGRSWPRFGDGDSAPADPAIIRVLVGPHADRFPKRAMRTLLDAVWTVRTESNRTGLRLAGPRVIERRGSSSLVSMPMVWGAVQLPPDGQPIVLLADHQTVGGYPVPVTVIRADRPIIGQLAPGDRCQLEQVTLAEAAEADRLERSLFNARLARLASEEAWNEQWRSAEG